MQGGGWYNDTGYLRIANRYNIDPAVSNIDLGFRCVRYPLPAQAETSMLASLPAEFTDEFGIGMALVPAGSFQMGSAQERSDELPVHTVELGDYYMDVTEVTNASYAAFLNAQGNQSEGGVTWLGAGIEFGRIHQIGGEWQAPLRYADHPVVVVSWYGAKAYCAWPPARPAHRSRVGEGCSRRVGRQAVPLGL